MATILLSEWPLDKKINASHVSTHGSTKPFLVLGEGAPTSESAETKLCWLRSQIIGGDAVFDGPFGTRSITYADHTASGRPLRCIEDYILNNVLPFYANSHTSDSYVGERTTKTVHEAAAYVKKCLGGGEDDALLFCGSGTTAAIKRLQEVMGIAVPSILRDMVLDKVITSEKRWIVFVGPYEHHSNILSWRQSLAEVIEIGLDPEGLLDVEELKSKLEFYQQTNRPMLGTFSACSNVTGIVSNTRALARLMHEHGAFVCFDFASSGPYVEIDMRSGEIDGYDAVFLSIHKFIGGPGSPGILLMNNALYQLKSSPPSTCGGGIVNFVNNFSEKDTLYMNDIEEREDAGTPPIIQKVRAALAFWVKEYIGYEVIHRQEQNYAQKALARFLPNQNVWVLGNTNAERQAIISFLIHTTTYSPDADANGKPSELYLWRESGNKRGKPLHGPFIAKLLNDLFGIQARGGCVCAAPYGHGLLNIDKTNSGLIRSAAQIGYNGFKPGWTRISLPYYMSDEEVEFVIASIEFLSIYGQRFLPLYHLNWKMGSWTFKEKAWEDMFPKENSLKFRSLPLFGTMAKQSNKDNIGVMAKYISYLENAKTIATLLPKFPAQRRVPNDIDINLIPFRV